HYGNENLTYNCIQSILREKHNFQTEILVINNSYYKTLHSLLSTFPCVKILTPSTNIGYAGGVNLGYRASSGNFILVLNNDIEVAPNCLRQLVDIMIRNEKIGICVPRKLLSSNTNLLDGAGSSLNLLLQGWDIGYLELDSKVYHVSRPIPYPPGAAFLIRREIAQLYNYLLDEDFFMYFDDPDLGIRAYFAGWETWYESSAKVFHHRGASGGIFTPITIYYFSRNSVFYLFKNFNSSLFLKFLPILFLKSVFILVLCVMVFGSKGFLHSVKGLLGFFEGLLLLPKFKKKKTMVMKIKQLSNRREDEYLKEFFSDEFVIPYPLISVKIAENKTFMKILFAIINFINIYSILVRIPAQRISKVRCILPEGRKQIFRMK
ncbi:MAG: glycosyltransferase, partial [Ignisphaera sp.]